MANQDFFLSPDDAQTLGNINYMRKSVRVRHTFPKNLKNPNGFEIIKEISSSEGKSVGNLLKNVTETVLSQLTSTNDTNNTNNPSPEPVKSFSKPRIANTSMDMFRNMARSLGKK
ncbi:MAG: hypothetical protein ACRC2S_22430 [Waterburya sp.]